MRVLATRLLSYSHVAQHRVCPRKFALRACTAPEFQFSTSDVNTAFGSAFGAAVAYILATERSEMRLARAKLIAFANWNVPLLAEIKVSRKSFTALIDAITKFHTFHAERMKEVYEVCDIFNRSSIEFGIGVSIPTSDGNPFVYKGNIDLILRNKITKNYVVVDIKTTSKSKDVAQFTYAKRSQVRMYAALLASALQLETVDYTYLVYNTSEGELFSFDYALSSADLAEELLNLQATCNTIAMHESMPRFPINGDACLAFGRPCEYWNACSGINPQNSFIEFDARNFTIFDVSKLLNYMPIEGVPVNIEELTFATDNKIAEEYANLSAEFDANFKPSTQSHMQTQTLPDWM